MEIPLLIRIVLLGEGLPAKTSLIQRSVETEIDMGLKMTIEVNIHTKNILVDGQEVKLNIWDLGGPRSIFKRLYSQYIKGALGGLFLYDVTNRWSIDHIDDWLSIIRKERNNKYIFPILVVGIITDENKEREVQAEEGMKVAKSLKVNGFIECNPKTGENVEEAFETLTRIILDKTGAKKNKKI